MKQLTIILLFISIACQAQLVNKTYNPYEPIRLNYTPEFSTYLKLNPSEMNYGVALTRKQKLIPWKITFVAISATTLEAVGDALYDMGKGTNQNQMRAGKVFQAASLGEHFLYSPVMKDSEASWLWIPVIEACWRFIIFDAVYNLTRGLPISYIGNTSYWDRGMKSFAPPAGMRLFADCIVGIFVVKLTFDKL